MKAKEKGTKTRKVRARKEKVETGSSNVFADLGLPNAEERLLKAKLATEIAQLIEKKGLTQAQTAERYSPGPAESLASSTRPTFRFFGGSTVRRPESPGSQC